MYIGFSKYLTIVICFVWAYTWNCFKSLLVLTRLAHTAYWNELIETIKGVLIDESVIVKTQFFNF